MAAFLLISPITSREQTSLTEPLLSLPAEEEENDRDEDPLLVSSSSLHLGHDEVGSYPGSSEDDEDENNNPAILSPNLSRILIFTWFAFTGRSIWSQSMLAVFIFLLQNQSHPETVGYVAAVMGMSQVIASFPAKYLANTFKRHTMLKLASGVGMGAVVIMVLGMFLPFRGSVSSSLQFLVVSLGLWGTSWGICDTALPVVFANSIPHHSRRPYYFRRGASLIRLGSVTGPLIAMVVFHYLGNEWTRWNCAVVMAVGLFICMPAIVILCYLKDRDDEDDDDNDDNGRYTDLPDEILLQENRHPQEYKQNDVEACYINATPELAVDQLDVSNDDGGEEEDQYSLSFEMMDRRNMERSGPRLWCGCRKQVLIPTLITFAEAVSGIASGMSIRYFPIFFVHQLHLSPIQVQSMYMITPLGQLAFTKLARYLASRFGAPCLVMVAFQWSFVCLLVSLILCHVKWGSPVWIVCSLYVLLASLMNSTSALGKAIVLNAVPRQDVGKWDFVDSLNMFVWSASAAFGGFLVGWKGIIFNFWVTAGLQLLASLPLIALFASGTTNKEQVTNGDGATNRRLFEDSGGENDLSNIAHVASQEEEEGDAVQDVGHDYLDSNSQSGFFSCHSAQSESNHSANATTTTTTRNNKVARYVNRQCTYEDGSPACVQQGDCDTIVPSHYLRACNEKRKNAIAMWKKSQKWRHENYVWKIHTLQNPWFPRIKEAYPHFVHGYSKEGYPVIYEQPGRMNLKQLFREGCDISDMTTWYTFFMEYLSNCICTRQEVRIAMGLDPSSNRNNSSSWGFVVVMDMEGVGLSLLSGDVLAYLRGAGEINSNHYPMSAKRSFVVKAGPVIAGAWSMIKGALPDSVQVQILSAKKYHSVLREYIVSMNFHQVFCFEWKDM
jgi:hypothetical protein